MVMPHTSAFVAELGIHLENRLKAGTKRPPLSTPRADAFTCKSGTQAARPTPASMVARLRCSPTATQIEGEINTPAGKVPHVAVHALTEAEIPAIVAAFAQGAKNAIVARL